MQDLLKEPMWRASDLGRAVPDDEFGVSVCLPRWADVIGYEERDPEVLRHFRSGYPRFCCPPAVGALFEAADQELAIAGVERCLVFPRVSHAQRCLEDIARQTGRREGRATAWRGLGVAIFPAEHYDAARGFWRFCGEVVSTRQARAALGRHEVETTVEQGREAEAVIRQRLADLSGQQAEDVFLFPSGMAANYAVHRMLQALWGARRTAQVDFPYVDVLKLQQRSGAGTHFLPLQKDGAELAQLAALMQQEELGAICVEAPSNPLLRCANLPEIQALRDARQAVTPLVVDDTVASVAEVDAFRYADVVTTSLTKAFSGVGDVLAGSVVLNRRSHWHARMQEFFLHQADHSLWHEDAVALEKNSRDFVQRSARFSASALELAQWLRQRPEIGRVWYPDQDGGAGFEAIRRSGGGHGCLLSLVLKDRSLSPAFFDALEVTKGPSLGTNFTLACPYVLLTHYDELDWAESCGVPRDLIRVSVGLEDPADLRARFEKALDRVGADGGSPQSVG